MSSHVQLGAYINRNGTAREDGSHDDSSLSWRLESTCHVIGNRSSAVEPPKSLREGFGLVVSEAMWKARPVVAGRVGGIQDQIEHGVSGVLIDDPTDGAAFASVAAGLLHDQARANDIGEAARARVLDRFLTPRQLVETLDLTAELI